MTFDKAIYVEAKTRWMLSRLAEAHNSSDRVTELGEAAINSNHLANTIIQGWVKQHHPKLNELWERRKQIDSEALSL